MTLRRELAKTNPRAMSRVHVGARIFEPRLKDAGDDQNGLCLVKAEYLATGGVFIIHDKPTELYPGVWLTGPVPRPNVEKNWFSGPSLVTAHGRVEDNVPEGSALSVRHEGGDRDSDRLWPRRHHQHCGVRAKHCRRQAPIGGGRRAALVQRNGSGARVDGSEAEVLSTRESSRRSLHWY